MTASPEGCVSLYWPNTQRTTTTEASSLTCRVDRQFKNVWHGRGCVLGKFNTQISPFTLAYPLPVTVQTR